MPCIFCIAVLMLVAGALTAEQLDDMEERLGEKADGEVRRTVDSESVAKFELKVRVGSRAVPVSVTVFKEHRRVRIQVLTHELTAQEVEALEDELAEALGAEVVDRSDPAHESPEHAARHEKQRAEDEGEEEDEREDDEEEEPERARERVRAREPERERLAERPRSRDD